MSRLLSSVLKPPEQHGITSYGCRRGRPSFGKRDPPGELASPQPWLRGEDASFDADVEQEVSMVKHALGRAGGKVAGLRARRDRARCAARCSK